jgi:hypothetical protein
VLGTAPPPAAAKPRRRNGQPQNTGDQMPKGKNESYAEWQNKVFQNLNELNERRNRIVLEELALKMGLTMDEVLNLHTPGMNGRQLVDAMEAARKK